LPRASNRRTWMTPIDSPARVSRPKPYNVQK
jgi:hypothetical protein